MNYVGQYIYVYVTTRALCGFAMGVAGEREQMPWWLLPVLPELAILGGLAYMVVSIPFLLGHVMAGKLLNRD